MKKVTSLIAFCLITVVTLWGQTTVTLGTGTTANTTTAHPTPYGTYYKNHRVQYLILASELNALGLSGPCYLHALGFNVQALNNCSAMPNFQIKLKHTSATVLTTTFDNTQGYVTVWTHPNFLPTVGWNTHTFIAPFLWNGVSNVLVDICFDIIPGNYTQNASVFYTVTPTNLANFFRSDATPACGTTSAATVSTNRANMQITYTNATGCLPPSLLTATNITPNSADLGWLALSGETEWNVQYGLTGFTLGTGTIVQANQNPFTLTGLNIVTTYDYYVQAVCNTRAVSDWAGPFTFTTTSYPLSGYYTINKNLPTGGNNFNSFSAFAQALNTGGLAGPVTVDVIPGSGPYTEQVLLGTVNNNTVSNPVIINGNGETLQFLSTNTSERATLRLNGTDYFTINNLIIKALGSQSTEFGYAVQLMNGADYITFNNCQFIVDQNSTSSNFAAFIAANSATSPTTAGLACSYLTINNCIARGGYYGILINGPSAAPFALGINVTNTVITDFYFYGLYLRGHQNSTFSGNTINRSTRTTLTTAYMIYLASDFSGTKIIKNRLHDFAKNGVTTGTAYGIYGTSITATVGQELLIANNLIYGLTNMNGAQYGIYLATANNVRVYHNTISLDNTSHPGTSVVYGFYHSGANSRVDVQNNIISYTTSSTGTKYCLYFATNTAIVTCNYNVLHRGSTAGTANHTGYWNGVSYTTLSDWKAAAGGQFDQNSSDANPLFINPLGGNMMPLNGAINNMGNNLLAFVPDDFFGVPRTPTPDPGAIEFTPVDCLPPSQLAATATATTATLSWVPGGQETSWDVEYGLAGFVQGTGTLLTGVGNPVTIYNLFPATLYEFYVRANCEGGVQSFWAGPKSFMTDCLPYNLPFNESFDLPQFAPLCWKNERTAGTSLGIWDRQTTGTNPTCTPYSGAAMARFNCYSYSSGTAGILVTPALNITSPSTIVDFWMFRDDGYLTNADKVNVHYNTQPNLTGATLLGTVNRSRNLDPPVPANGWYNYKFSLPAAAAGQVGYVIFEGVSAFGNNIFIDHVAIYQVVTGTLAGTVTEKTRGPIQGAKVSSGPYQAFSNENGEYVIEGILPGTYTFKCEKEGYFTETVPGVVIVGGETTVLNFQLGYATIAVSPTSISAQLYPGGATTETLSISNPTGTEPLTWSAAVQIIQPQDYPAHQPLTIGEKQALSTTNPDLDIAPETTTISGSESRAMWDILLAFSVNSGAQQGVCTDGQFIYTSFWQQAGKFAKYTLTGAFVEEFTISGVGAIRNLTYDGQYFYGGAASTLVYQIDLTNKVLIGTFPSPVNVRHISYDPVADGFWVGDWTSLRLISRTGATLITGPTLNSVYGSAYDKYTPGGPYLWFYAQVATPGCGTSYDLVQLQQFHIPSLTFTGFVRCTNDIPGYIPGTSTSNTIAGGAFATDQLIPGKFVLMVNVQQTPNLIGVYELATLYSWITLGTNNGVVNPGQTQNVAVNLNAEQLEEGVYQANINITHNGQVVGDPVLTVPVQLTVVAPSAPGMPTNPDPADGATMVPLQPVFNWTNGAFTAQARIRIERIQFPFNTLVHETPFFAGNSFDLASVGKTLIPKANYRWRVTCKNSVGETVGPWWTFQAIGQGTIAGIVTDAYSGNPIGGVYIYAEILRNGYSTTTGDDGTYSIPNVLEGQYRVTASKDGYVSQNTIINVNHNQTTTVNFALSIVLHPPTNLNATVENIVNVRLTWEPPMIFVDGGNNYPSLNDDRPPFTGREPVDEVAPSVSGSGYSGKPASMMDIGRDVLYNNVNFINGQCATTQDPESVVISPSTLFGSNCNQAAGYSVADNFTVPGGQVWNINSIEFYSYQTGSTTTSTFTGCYVRIWNGNPMEGGQIIWGNLTTNIMSSTSFSGVYRVSSTTSCNTQRPLMKVIANTAGLVLTPGTYWVEFAATGTLTSGPWYPTVYNANGTAIQYTGTSWQKINNSTTPPDAFVELPFIIHGTVGGGIVPPNLLGFNIYRNGNFLAYVPKARTYEYLDQSLDPGQYSYTVTGVYIQGESAPVGPVSVGILLPPTLQTAQQVGNKVYLQWTSNVPDGVTPRSSYIEENYLGSQMPAKESEFRKPHVNPDNSRQGGDNISNATVIPSIPYTNTGTTQGYTDDYNVACPFTATGAPDVVYAYTPTSNISINIDLCNSLYDTKVYVFQNTAGNSIACNDDACGSDGWKSKLENVPLFAGNTYYIVIDGYDATSYGTYNLVITQYQGPSCTVECPQGSILEGEPCPGDNYVDNFNGGCNSTPPVFSNIAPGNVICGTASTYTSGGSNSRDTDWYLFTLNQPSLVTVTGTAEFPLRLFLINLNSGCSNPVVITTAFGEPCTNVTITDYPLAPGTYVLWVGPNVFTGYPCTSENNTYVVSLQATSTFMRSFNIWRNGEFLANTYSTSYYDTNIEQGQQYCYTVSEVVTPQIETGMSNMLCVNIPFYGQLTVTPPTLEETHINPPKQTTKNLLVTNIGQGETTFAVNINFLSDGRPSGLCQTNLYTTGCTYGDGLTSWSLANINVPSIPCSGTPAWYKDYTHMIHQLEVGGSYVLTVTAGYSSTYFDVWIDFNGDNALTDNELVINDAVCSAANTVYTFPFNVPAGVQPGLFTMRARTNWLSPVTGPCVTYTYGNAIDFSVQLGVPWLSVAPTTGTLLPGQSMPLLVTFNSQSLGPGVYGAVIAFTYDNPFQRVTISVPVSFTVLQTVSQIINLPIGWSGWSSYADPLSDASFANVVAPVAANMIISQYFTQLYYPEFGINTMGDFTTEHGYISKMLDGSLLTVTGLMTDMTVEFTAGWNLMPVPVNYNVPAAMVFGQIPGLIIAFEVAGNGIYYPAGQVYTLTTVAPGKAYWVKVAGPTSFTFPVFESNAAGSWVAPIRPENITSWNDVEYTGVSHIVVFNAQATQMLNQGDVIGAFTLEGRCAGMTIVEGNVASLAVFGDDITTSVKDGFAEGEPLSFRLYRPGVNQEYLLDVTYSGLAPNADGIFAANGLTVVSDLTMSTTGIGNTGMTGMKVYPNPSQGIFHLTIGGAQGEYQWEVSDSRGQVLITGVFHNSTTIDLSNYPKGIYMLKVSGNGLQKVEKLIVK